MRGYPNGSAKPAANFSIFVLDFYVLNVFKIVILNCLFIK